MTEVACSRPEVTALAPPPAPLITNRNASPSRSPTSHRSPPGSRLNLAKEQLEDREKTQEMSEVLQQKERRAQQQLGRCAKERGRKMEEQRRKEQQRRAAAEQKRRQQQEAEKVRGHSTRMMHSLHLRKSGKTGTCCWVESQRPPTSTDTEMIFLQSC